MNISFVVVSVSSVIGGVIVSAFTFNSYKYRLITHTHVYKLNIELRIQSLQSLGFFLFIKFAAVPICS